MCNDLFGWSVAMSPTGNKIAAGAIYCDPGGITYAGAAYIFNRSNTEWEQIDKLTANDKSNDDYYGDSVAIDVSGNIIALGAAYSSPECVPHAGAVYIYSF